MKIRTATLSSPIYKNAVDKYMEAKDLVLEKGHLLDEWSEILRALQENKLYNIKSCEDLAGITREFTLLQHKLSASALAGMTDLLKICVVQQAEHNASFCSEGADRATCLIYCDRIQKLVSEASIAFPGDAEVHAIREQSAETLRAVSSGSKLSDFRDAADAVHSMEEIDLACDADVQKLEGLLKASKACFGICLQPDQLEMVRKAYRKVRDLTFAKATDERVAKTPMICLAELNSILLTAGDGILAGSGQQQVLEESVELALRLMSWTPVDTASAAGKLAAGMELQGQSQLLRTATAAMVTSGGEGLPAPVLDVVAAVQVEAEELLGKLWASRYNKAKEEFDSDHGQLTRLALGTGTDKHWLDGLDSKKATKDDILKLAKDTMLVNTDPKELVNLIGSYINKKTELLEASSLVGKSSQADLDAIEEMHSRVLIAAASTKMHAVICAALLAKVSGKQASDLVQAEVRSARKLGVKEDVCMPKALYQTVQKAMLGQL